MSCTDHNNDGAISTTTKVEVVTSSSNSSSSNSTNVTWHTASVLPAERHALRGHTGVVVWFTGLSGSGKSSIANAVEALLVRRRHIASTYILDGDNIRLGLNQNLGFSPEDRVENIRRIGETAKLFCDAGIIVLTAFISPYRQDRDTVRALISSLENSGNDDDDDKKKKLFFEVHVQASLATCEGRDPKGLYKKARAGEITNFTGIDAPYEAPLQPELVLDSNGTSVEQLAEEVVRLLECQGIIPFL